MNTNPELLSHATRIGVLRLLVSSSPSSHSPRILSPFLFALSPAELSGGSTSNVRSPFMLPASCGAILPASPSHTSLSRTAPQFLLYPLPILYRCSLFIISSPLSAWSCFPSPSVGRSIGAHLVPTVSSVLIIARESPDCF